MLPLLSLGTNDKFEPPGPIVFNLCFRFHIGHISDIYIMIYNVKQTVMKEEHNNLVVECQLNMRNYIKSFYLARLRITISDNQGHKIVHI